MDFGLMSFRREVPKFLYVDLGFGFRVWGRGPEEPGAINNRAELLF